MDSLGNAVERYQQGMTIDGIEGRQLGQTELSDRYIKDHLGSVMKVIREYGTAENEYIYDSFGNIIYQSGTLTNQRLYTSRFYDSESRLYYYRARYYDPETGRFLSVDPIGFVAGVNLFVYVENNPINFKDPLGWQKIGIRTSPKWNCEEMVEKIYEKTLEKNAKEFHKCMEDCYRKLGICATETNICEITCGILTLPEEVTRHLLKIKLVRKAICELLEGLHTHPDVHFPH
jgi:RHS repeat-associated protein